MRLDFDHWEDLSDEEEGEEGEGDAEKERSAQKLLAEREEKRVCPTTILGHYSTLLICILLGLCSSFIGANSL